MREGPFHGMGYDIEPAKARCLAERFLGHARKVLKNIVHFKMTKIDFCLPAALEQYNGWVITEVSDPAYSEFYEVSPKEEKS